jgi:hypothetical protein
MDPEIPVGSILRIVTSQGRTITTCVMEKITAGQKATYRCTGSPRRDSTTALNNRPAGQKNPAQGLTQAQIFNTLTNQGQEQGLFLQDGKVYINAQYLLAGSFHATAEVFLDPGLPEAAAIEGHLLGVSPIPAEKLPDYDFNADGEVTVSDMLLARQCALGKATLRQWAGAVKTPVTVTLDPGDPERVVQIRGVNMWGREVAYYLGLSGTNMGAILTDLILSGRIFLTEAAVADALPAVSQPGQLLLVKGQSASPWTPCQCYIGT